jgi:hypothetical protein
MLTLIEAAKVARDEGKEFQAAIIEVFAQNSPILAVMPFRDIQGNALAYNLEGELPGVGFRGVNEGYTESTGVINPKTETLTIAGGDLDVDKFIVDTMGGESQRSVHEALKIKALALSITRTFIKGDNETNPKEFSGLQARIVGSQKIAAGATANGTALSLAKLDELIDAVENPTHLIMNKSMRRKLTVAVRAGLGGTITQTKDDFGRRFEMYNDLPIIIVDKDNTNTDILPFTEAATSGTSTATSIYCVSMGEDGLTGIQNGGIDSRDLGELESKPAYRTRVEWYVGQAIFNGRKAARLWSIADAAVTA